MHGIEERITAWRQELAETDSIDRDTLRELESHLRDAIDHRLEAGEKLDVAFAGAAAEVGESAELGAEFRKIYPDYSWAQRIIWMLAGFVIVKLVAPLAAAARLLVTGHLDKLLPTESLTLSNPIEIEGGSFFIAEPGLHHFDSIPVSIIGGVLANWLVYGLAIWLGIRWMLAKTPLLDRFFELGSPKKLVAAIGSILALLVILSTSLFWRVFRALSGFSEDSIAASFGYGNPAALGYYLSTYAHTITLGLLFAFSVWATFRLRANRSRPYVAWMFGGYFLVASLMLLTMWASALAGVGLSAAGAVDGSHFYGQILPGLYHNTSAGAIAGIVILLVSVAICLATFALAAGAFVRPAEHLFGRFWNHGTFLTILFFIPYIWQHAISLANLGKYPIHTDHNGFWAVLNQSMITIYQVTPWAVSAVLLVAGFVMLRENRGLPESDEPIDA